MKPSPPSGDDVLAALDELFGAIDKYRTSKGFQELLEFLKRLPTVGPYNGLLLHIQRPGVTNVATVRGWMRLGREVKREANPLVTLKAFGPVEFVYDILDTTGPDLPPDVYDPFRTSGQLSSLILERTVMHAESDRISIRDVEFGAQLAGCVSGQRPGRRVALLGTGEPAALVVELNKNIALEARYATLVHELGHVYCGHLGVPSDAWWSDRTDLNIRPREFEAEAVAWIVCSRQGLDPGSYRYLEGYLGTDKDVPDISLNQVMVAANYIEMLGTGRFRRKKPEGTRRADRPEISGTVSLNTGEPIGEEAIRAKEVQEQLALATQGSLFSVEADDA